MNQTLSGKPGAVQGGWHAVLEVDDKYFKKYLSSLDNEPDEMNRVNAHGVRYSLNVHTYSNLHMAARLSQSGSVPGSTFFLRAVMTEYGLPMTARVNVSAEVTRPDGTVTVVSLTEIDPGVFESSLSANAPGVYAARVIAEGRTLRGRDFTREHTLTAAVWQGGNTPPDPSDPDDRGDDGLCRLLDCLLNHSEFVEYLRRHKLPVDAIRECVEKICRHDVDPGRPSARDVLAARPELRQALVVLGKFLKEASQAD